MSKRSDLLREIEGVLARAPGTRFGRYVVCLPGEVVFGTFDSCATASVGTWRGDVDPVDTAPICRTAAAVPLVGMPFRSWYDARNPGERTER